MTENICTDCGLTPGYEIAQHSLNKAAFIKLDSVKGVMMTANQPDYAAAIEKVLTEWRTHALPACDPLAIS
jgi:hypothetical protein